MAFLVYIDLSSDFILGISYPPYSLITILFIHKNLKINQFNGKDIDNTPTKCFIIELKLRDQNPNKPSYFFSH